MTIEITTVEACRLHYLLNLAQDNTVQQDLHDTANKVKTLIEDNIQSLSEFIANNNK